MFYKPDRFSLFRATPVSSAAKTAFGVHGNPDLIPDPVFTVVIF
jgi:hypothetical protein